MKRAADGVTALLSNGQESGRKGPRVHRARALNTEGLRLEDAGLAAGSAARSR